MERLVALVLGSAAGGGVPQWNCRCHVCRSAWSGDGRVQPRSQTCLAISADRRHWTLLNAPPDLRAQILAQPALQPRADGELRGSPVAAVLLTGTEVDQAAGLLVLREAQPFTLIGTAESLRILADNPMFRVLAAGAVTRRAAKLGEALPLPGGMTGELFAVPGKAPLFLEGEAPDLAAEGEGNVGIEVRANGRSIVFVPSAAALTPALTRRLAAADAVFFDGTLFTDDEMIRMGTGTKTGRRMGHMPIDGADGSLAALSEVGARRHYIHINNTNPILIAGSAERRRVEEAGWTIAHDGQEIVL